MSGASRSAPAARGTVQLRLPRMTERADATLINAAFDMLERADAQDIKTGQTPVFGAVILISRPGGIAYQLTVADNGAVTVTPVPPGAVPSP